MRYKTGDVLEFPNHDLPRLTVTDAVDNYTHQVYFLVTGDGLEYERKASFVDYFGVQVNGEPEEPIEDEVVPLSAVLDHPTPEPRSDLKWIGVDLDGTLAEPVWTADNPTHEVGPPIQRNVEKLMAAHRAGYKVCIHTSRAWTDYETVEAWLDYYAIPYKLIQMGKPLFSLYIDDRGRHESAESWIPSKEQSG